MTKTKRMFLAAAVTLALVAAHSPARAQVVCGQTITTKATLTGDVLCATEPALTIGVGGSLNMHGFTVACDGTDDGIVLAGEGAKLLNGVVEDCAATAVRLDGGKHKINAVTARDSLIGFDGLSGGNKLTDCNASNNDDGLSIEGTGNKLTRVTAHLNTFSGINIGGDGNKLSEVHSVGGLYGISVNGVGNKLAKSTASTANNDGFTITGDENKASGNTAAGNQGTGFVVLGDRNKLSKNTSNHSGVRGFDIAGADNALSKNSVSSAATEGIYVAALSTTTAVAKNTVFNCQTGIYVEGTACTIKSNIVLGSALVGLQDATLGCDNNEWSKNVGQKGQACIE